MLAYFATRFMHSKIKNHLSLFRCPVSFESLHFEPASQETKLQNKSATHTYKTVSEQPVLVDFETSVLSEAHLFETKAESAIQRNAFGNEESFLKKLVAHPSSTSNFDLLFKEIKQNNPKPVVLIVGGGALSKGLEQFYEDPDTTVLSFDIYASAFTDFIADGHNIPMHNNAVDGVVVVAVLEHVLDPQQVVSEIWRVLKPGGVVFADTPFMQQVHEGAFDFTRFTESGHRYLFKRFELIQSGYSATAGTALMWAIEYFFRGLFRSIAMGKMAKLAFFWLKYFDAFIPKNYATDSASGVYFIGRKSDKTLSAKEIIAHYQGAY